LRTWRALLSLSLSPLTLRIRKEEEGAISVSLNACTGAQQIYRLPRLATLVGIEPNYPVIKSHGGSPNIAALRGPCPPPCKRWLPYGTGRQDGSTLRPPPSKRVGLTELLTVTKHRTTTASEKALVSRSARMKVFEHVQTSYPCPTKRGDRRHPQTAIEHHPPLEQRG
jgi:hypothetical protein